MSRIIEPANCFWREAYEKWGKKRKLITDNAIIPETILHVVCEPGCLPEKDA